MIAKLGWCLIAWISLAACGGARTSSTHAPGSAPPGPAPAPIAPPAAEVTCQHGVDALFAVTAGKEPPDLSARASKVFVHRCEADRWSGEIRGCMAAVKVAEDADRCEGMLTYEQKRDLGDELARELDAAGVKPETTSGRPKARPEAAPKTTPEATKKQRAKPAPPAPGQKRTSDPDEGGE